MKYNLYEQFTVLQRAELLLGKYSLPYLKEVINGLITQSRKSNDTHVCNYWNEVAVKIKEILKTKNK
jgi:hypothetical protein